MNGNMPSLEDWNKMDEDIKDFKVYEVLVSLTNKKKDRVYTCMSSFVGGAIMMLSYIGFKYV
jgi:hypothetical protein